jgi:hypothetical protein
VQREDLVQTGELDVHLLGQSTKHPAVALVCLGDDAR